MGYPGRKKPLGNDMTGGHGALPFFVAFMKDFLKDKPKEDFEKPPAQPEDLKELQKQRQREMMEGLHDILAKRPSGKAGDEETPTTISNPKMEQVTLPPAPQIDEPPPMTAPPATTAAPKKTEADTTPQTPPATRPREVEAPKKKGKKGTDEP
jgi:membrane carboxypeptidase/penicillin-binding protein